MLDIDPSLEDYILEHISPEGDVLEELTRQTNLKTVHPQMNSGHLQGKLLEIISKLIRPGRILEIGISVMSCMIWPGSILKDLECRIRLYSLPEMPWK